MGNYARRQDEEVDQTEHYRYLSLPERHRIYTDFRYSITLLSDRLRREPDSDLAIVLRSLQRMALMLEADEEIVREEEIRATYNMLAELGYGTRIWFLQYREKENML
jgi:hypothetical protein